MIREELRIWVVAHFEIEPRPGDSTCVIGQWQWSRPTRDVVLPDERAPECWTGCESVVDLTGAAQFRATERPGRYQIWLPERAWPLYNRWQAGDGAELRDPGVCVLGGGTVLAAIWRHRESHDIDVFWPRGRWSDAELKERVDRWAASLDQAPFHCDVGGRVAKVAWSDGDVDFVEADMLEHRSGRSRIARANVSVAGVDEILAGKLHGRYDAAVCVLKAPRAWERAVEWCMRRSGRGGELIGKIRARMDRVSRDGLWLARRSESIVGPGCPQAWASGPELVAESLDRLDGRGRGRARARPGRDGPEL